jgi:hypothetical protein
MDFELDARTVELRQNLLEFMREHAAREQLTEAQTGQFRDVPALQTGTHPADPGHDLRGDHPAGPGDRRAARAGPPHRAGLHRLRRGRRDAHPRPPVPRNTTPAKSSSPRRPPLEPSRSRTRIAFVPAGLPTAPPALSAPGPRAPGQDGPAPRTSQGSHGTHARKTGPRRGRSQPDAKIPGRVKRG